MLNSIYDGNTETVKIVKLKLEEEYLNYPMFEFKEYSKPEVVSINDASAMSVNYSTYRTEVKEIITKDRKRIKLALDKSSQELVDLFIDLKTNELRNRLEMLYMEKAKLHQKVYELEASWFSKIVKWVKNA